MMAIKGMEVVGGLDNGGVIRGIKSETLQGFRPCASAFGERKRFAR
jgi:hypothetical protein